MFSFVYIYLFFEPNSQREGLELEAEGYKRYFVTIGMNLSSKDTLYSFHHPFFRGKNVIIIHVSK